MASLDVHHAEIVRDSASGAIMCVLQLLNGIMITTHPIACSLPLQLKVRVLERNSALSPHDQLIERSIDKAYDSVELVALDSIGRIACVSLTKGDITKTFKLYEKSEDLDIWPVAWKGARTMKLNVTSLTRLGYGCLDTLSFAHCTPQKMRIYSPSLFMALKLLTTSTAHLEPTGNLRFLPPPTITTYYYEESLGEGTFGSVECLSLTTGGELHACKTLKTTDTSFEDYWQSVIAECSFTLCPKVRLLALGAAQIWMKLGSTDTLSDISDTGVCMGMQGAVLHLSFMREIARDLHKMHYRGIAHCDLKASNVLARNDGTARIIDFGSASLYEGPASYLKCTIDYCAPEVLENQVWLAGDVWSLGVMALDLCKGVRRGSLVKYDEDGYWPTGKKWNWKNDQYLIAREQIRRRIADKDEGIVTFIERLDLQNISIGQAALLSMTLQVLPGERDNMGLCDLIRPISMLRWPFPIGPLEPLLCTSTPRENGTQRTIASYSTLHLTLDGSTYADSSEIPNPQGRSTAVGTRRAQQLQYISLVLRALDKSTPKNFILTLDVLDRVSSPANLLELAKETPPSHFMLENACIIVASMVSQSHCLTSDHVLRQWKCLVAPIHSYSVAYLQTLVLRVLSTMQFKIVREDNVWELCGHNTKFEPYLKHMLESYLTWPNGTTDVYQHSNALISFLNTCDAPNLPSWHPRIRFKIEKDILKEQWHHSKFESTLVSLGHASTTPLPVSTSLPAHTTFNTALTPGNSSPFCALGVMDFRHPFLLPFDSQLLAGVSRKDFEAGVTAYVSAATSTITQQQNDMDACIVCTKDSERNCTQCESWSLCPECYRDFSGCCPQCLRTPELAQEWFRRSALSKAHGKISGT